MTNLLIMPVVYTEMSHKKRMKQELFTTLGETGTLLCWGEQLLGVFEDLKKMYVNKTFELV